MKKQTTLDKLDFQNLIIEFFSKNRCKKIVRKLINLVNLMIW